MLNKEDLIKSYNNIKKVEIYDHKEAKFEYLAEPFNENIKYSKSDLEKNLRFKFHLIFIPSKCAFACFVDNYRWNTTEEMEGFVIYTSSINYAIRKVLEKLDLIWSWSGSSKNIPIFQYDLEKEKNK